MNKHESAFVDNLIRNCKANDHCIRCEPDRVFFNEIVSELKLLQSGKVTSRQVRLTNI